MLNYHTVKCEHCEWIGSSKHIINRHAHSKKCPLCTREFLAEAYEEHLDPNIPLEVPKGTLARLRKNGRAHMSRARRRNKAMAALNAAIADPKFHHPIVDIVDFDPIEVYEEHNWTCVKCFRRVDIYQTGRHPKSCVLGHQINMANGGGHTPDNCGPWHFECNALEAHATEIPREAKVKRLRSTQQGKEKKHGKGRIKSKGFSKGLKSNPWPKGRKIQNRNSFR